MNKAIEWFTMGLCFGMGFAIAQAVCHLLAALLEKA